MISLQSLSLKNLVANNKTNDLNFYFDLEVDKNIKDIFTSKHPIELINIYNQNNLKEEEINLIIDLLPANLLYVLLYNKDKIKMINRMQIIIKCKDILHHLFLHINDLSKDEIIYAINNTEPLNLNSLFDTFYKLSDKETDLLFVSKNKKYIDKHILDIILKRSEEYIIDVIRNIYYINILYVCRFLFINHHMFSVDIIIQYKKYYKEILTRCSTFDILEIFNTFDLNGIALSDLSIMCDILIERCDISVAYKVFLKLNKISKRNLDILINKVKRHRVLFYDNVNINTIIDCFDKCRYKEEYIFINFPNMFIYLLFDKLDKLSFYKYMRAYIIYYELSMEETISIITRINNDMIIEIPYIINHISKEDFKIIISVLNKRQIIDYKILIKNIKYLTNEDKEFLYNELWLKYNS